jgi:hypothetical protein
LLTARDQLGIRAIWGIGHRRPVHGRWQVPARC